MRVLIVGAGAVGGYFGARWISGGADVTFLVKPSRRTAIAEFGLTVTGVRPETHVKPKAITVDELQGSFDIVFLTVPGDAIETAVRDIRPAVGPSTLILTSLNGARHFAILRNAFGEDRVPGCVVKCVTKLDDMGRVVELVDLAQITFGPWSGRSDHLLDAAQIKLNIGGVKIDVSPNILTDIAEKWLMMAALGSANSLLDGDIAAINASPFGAWAIQAILQEAHLALRESGFEARSEAVATMSRAFADKTSHQTSSLYRNMKMGRPVELDPIIKDLLARVSDPKDYPLLSAACGRLELYTRSQGMQI